MILISDDKKNDILPNNCPHCQEKNFIKYGYFKEVQRYKCKSCKKTFCNRTNSPWYYSKKNNFLWFEFWNLLSVKTTLDQCSKILKINIATAFNWRHKIFNTIQFLTEPEYLCDTISITKRIIPENYKGPFKSFLPKSNKIWYVIAADSNDNVLTMPFCLNIWDRTAFNNLVYDKIDENSCVLPFGDSYIYNATKNYGPYPNNNYIDEDDEGFDYIPSNSNKIKSIVLKTLFSFNEILDKAYGISTKYIKHYLAFAKCFVLEENFSHSSILERIYPTSTHITCNDIKNINTFK